MRRFRNNESSAPRGPSPIFDVSLSVKLNELMAEQLVDLFDQVVDARITIQPETWAFYKQLENWVGQREPSEV